jgi:hypothetical protein
LRYSAFLPESSATPRGENTGRSTSSNVAVSSPVSVFTTASPFPSELLVTFGMVAGGRAKRRAGLETRAGRKETDSEVSRRRKRGRGFRRVLLRVTIVPARESAPRKKAAGAFSGHRTRVERE